MTTPACTEDTFDRNVLTHRMRIVRDDGLHRHIQFRRLGSGVYWFDIITWPGALCIDGDCGTFVFRRLDDMFEFFRTDREHGKWRINPQYWAEKCTAADRSGIQAYSREAFAEAVNRWVDDFLKDGDGEDWPPARAATLREAIKQEVLTKDETEQDAHEAAAGFSFDGFTFSDFWEVNCREYTHHFLWCCYAIQYGISLYDKAKEPVTP